MAKLQKRKNENEHFKPKTDIYIVHCADIHTYTDNKKHVQTITNIFKTKKADIYRKNRHAQ